MTLNHDSKDLLYILACECESLFDQLQDSSLTSHLDATADLCAEFQQRFAIWAAHLGVFARRSNCLDTRLRNHADLQDLVARLLDVLRCGLQQCIVGSSGQAEPGPTPTSLDESEPRAFRISLAALTAIDDTLTRLNRLGVSIRQASYDKIDARASRFAASLEPNTFEHLCASAVQALYPGAHQALKNHLTKSMTDRYARMLMLGSQYKKHRESHAGLSPSVGEGLIPHQHSTGQESFDMVAEDIVDPETLSKSEWRQHVDQDLEPYVCLSEGCSEAYPVFPTFDKWVDHMELHNRRWHRETYLKPSWVCAICEVNPDVYHSPQALYSHLKEFHDGDFTKKQLQCISRQSMTKQPRAWNDCFLCCFAVDEHDNEAEVILRKRQKGQSKQEKTKCARKALDMTKPDARISGADCSEMLSDVDDIGSHPDGSQKQKTMDASRAIARHIAVHLQGLMLLTLRFAALQSHDEDFDDDIKSNSVEMDEEAAY
ncbi:hypothetical protein HRG_009241 [Hirsutella rhossiliensis]